MLLSKHKGGWSVEGQPCPLPTSPGVGYIVVPHGPSYISSLSYRLMPLGPIFFSREVGWANSRVSVEPVAGATSHRFDLCINVPSAGSPMEQTFVYFSLEQCVLKILTNVLYKSYPSHYYRFVSVQEFCLVQGD